MTVKDLVLVLSQQLLWSLLRLLFDPWLGNFFMPCVWPKIIKYCRIYDYIFIIISKMYATFLHFYDIKWLSFTSTQRTLFSMSCLGGRRVCVWYLRELYRFKILHVEVSVFFVWLNFSPSPEAEMVWCTLLTAGLPHRGFETFRKPGGCSRLCMRMKIFSAKRVFLMGGPAQPSSLPLLSFLKLFKAVPSILPLKSFWRTGAHQPADEQIRFARQGRWRLH